MRLSSTWLISSLLVALACSAGCTLATEGQKGPVSEEPNGAEADVWDASSSVSPSTPSTDDGPRTCNLACAADSHCELRGGTPVCLPAKGPAWDAGPIEPPSTLPPSIPPPATCNLACNQGSRCVLEAQGPACTPESGIVDAGPPPVVTCSLTCDPGRHCQITAKGESCVLDRPLVDAGQKTPCGVNVCAVDEMCCSPSCGKCAPRSGVCPAMACPVVDAEVPKQTCANASCPAGTYCDDITGSVECKELPSCKTVKCTATTTCELVPVQCVRAPCPPQPQCVPKEPQVCDLICKVGTRCAITSNGPKCEPDPDWMDCDTKTCKGGQVCCNPNCGSCGPKDGACLHVVCATDEARSP